MIRYRLASGISAAILATGSCLFGCGNKAEKTVTCPDVGAMFQCFCPPDNRVGQLTCLPTHTFSLCDCSGSGGGGSGDTSAVSGTAGAPDTESAAEQPASDQTGTGGKSGTATTAKKKAPCPNGFTCSLDNYLKAAYVCNPPDPTKLFCTTKEDCKNIGLPEAECIAGPGWSACGMKCVP